MLFFYLVLIAFISIIILVLLYLKHFDIVRCASSVSSLSILPKDMASPCLGVGSDDHVCVGAIVVLGCSVFLIVVLSTLLCTLCTRFINKDRMIEFPKQTPGKSEECYF